MRIINTPARKIGIVTLKKLEKWAIKNNKSFLKLVMI